MTIKIYGRKRKVLLLKEDDRLEKEDIYINNFDGKEMTNEEKYEKLKESKTFETNSIGELVSEHPNRIYFRLL